MPYAELIKKLEALKKSNECNMTMYALSMHQIEFLSSFISFLKQFQENKHSIIRQALDNKFLEFGNDIILLGYKCMNKITFEDSSEEFNRKVCELFLSLKYELSKMHYEHIFPESAPMIKYAENTIRHHSSYGFSINYSRFFSKKEDEYKTKTNKIPRSYSDSFLVCKERDRWTSSDTIKTILCFGIMGIGALFYAALRLAEIEANNIDIKKEIPRSKSCPVI